MLYYGFLGVKVGGDVPRYIFEVGYDMKLLSVIAAKAHENLIYALNPAFHPGLIGPLERLVVPDDGSVFRRHLEKKSVGISLQHRITVNVLDLELIERPFTETGHE